MEAARVNGTTQGRVQPVWLGGERFQQY